MWVRVRVIVRVHVSVLLMSMHSNTNSDFDIREKMPWRATVPRATVLDPSARFVRPTLSDRSDETRLVNCVIGKITITRDRA